MNNWQLSGQALGLYVEFLKDGEFVVPDAGSIHLTIRDNSGSPIVGYDKSLQADVNITSVLFTIPDSVNQVSSGRETRFVRVDFTSMGIPCYWVDSYRLTSFIPITAQPKDVRNLLGARDREVKDSEVDLYDAYFKLLRTNPAIATALTVTDDRAMYANNAIALQAALTLIPSMPVRAMKEEALNNADLIRATIDWEALEAKLLGQLNDALDNVNSETDPVMILRPIFVVSTPTDPVTNA